jgi:hypothetical protein
MNRQSISILFLNTAMATEDIPWIFSDFSRDRSPPLFLQVTPAVEPATL